MGTANGTTATANGIGIDIQGTNNKLGLEGQVNSGNQVAGNTGIGIYVESGTNYAYYNLVGLQSDGTSSLKNGGGGIKINSGGQLKFGPGNKIKA